METMKPLFAANDLVSEDSFYENLTLGVTKLLESNERVCNVAVERRPPSDRVALSTWEQRHSVSLPDEIRQFFASTDGFKLTWSYKYSQNEIAVAKKQIMKKIVTTVQSNQRPTPPTRRNLSSRQITGETGQAYGQLVIEDYVDDDEMQANDILPVGCININALNELCMTPSLKELLDLAQARQANAQTNTLPNIDIKTKVVELDDCKTIGKVVLVIINSEASVWLLGRDGVWTWLANNFVTYFRMALVHQGLPGWQGLFSKSGILPWAEQLFLLIAPHLLEAQNNGTIRDKILEDQVGLNHIDPTIFKPPSRHNVRAANQTTR